MTRDEIDEQVAKYLSNGGEVDVLRYADKKILARASRAEFHIDRAMDGSEKSKKYLDNMRARESGMIFSKTDRWKK